MKRTIFFSLALFFFFPIGCTKPTPDEIYIKNLQTRLEKMEKELASYDKKIEAAPNAGAVYEQINSRDLLRSRIERIKAKLSSASPQEK